MSYIGRIYSIKVDIGRVSKITPMNRYITNLIIFLYNKFDMCIYIACIIIFWYYLKLEFKNYDSLYLYAVSNHHFWWSLMLKESRSSLTIKKISVRRFLIGKISIIIKIHHPLKWTYNQPYNLVYTKKLNIMRV